MEARAALPTPLFTRHMRGAIEAERDRRLASRATRRQRTAGRTAMAHRKIGAALAAEASRMTQARMAYSRWADDGGRLDARRPPGLRIGDMAEARR
jgi:hypothetical protein